MGGAWCPVVKLVQDLKVILAPIIHRDKATFPERHNKSDWANPPRSACKRTNLYSFRHSKVSELGNGMCQLLDSTEYCNMPLN